MCRSFSERFDSNEKMFLKQFCLLFQIFIVIHQVVVEIVLEEVQEKTTIPCELEKFTIRTFPE